MTATSKSSSTNLSVWSARQSLHVVKFNREEIFKLKESSFHKGENFQIARVVGTWIDRSRLKPWPLDATETRNKCGPNGPHQEPAPGLINGLLGSYVG